MGLAKGVPINRYCDQHHLTPRQRLELIGAGRFGQEGKPVADAASAGTIRLVDPGTGRDFASLEDPSQDTTSPSIFTPDGTNVSAFSSGKVNGIHVRDLRLIPGSDGTNPVQLTDANGTLYFAATDGSDGTELWKSDGTSAGTVIVKDINPGSTPSNPTDLTNEAGTLFFTADDGTDGTELWKSDGTAAGTTLVKDIYRGSYRGYFGGLRPSSSHPSDLTKVNVTLFFAADDGTDGVELWKSDGTADGTTLVKDLYPGSYDYDGYSYSNSSDPKQLTTVGGTLFFAANHGTDGVELWTSDGTAAGTVMVADINLGSGGSGLAQLTDVNGTLFFTADDGTHGDELWRSDGTAEGTVMVADINPGTSSTFPRYLTDVNGTLYFAADNGTHDAALWKSDGTAAGTTLVKDLFPGGSGTNPSNLTNVDGTLFFLAQGRLWKSDGTAEGTLNLEGGDAPSQLTGENGTLSFLSSDSTNGIELWKSDGTAASTTLLKDIFPGVYDQYYYGYYGGRYSRYIPNSSNPHNLTDVNGTLFFTANDGNGAELWKSDGTVAGTVLVADINSDSSSSSPSVLTNLNGTLFFAADDGAHGTELWQSDGTAAGTVVVADINPGGTGSYPSGLTNAGGTLYFTAVDGVHGNELWELSTTVPTLVVSGFSTSTTAGAPGSFTVRADNADGSTDTSYTGTVHFTSSDGQAFLPSDYTFTPAGAGVHTFSATLKTAGTQSLMVTNTASAGEAGVESGITILAGAASQLAPSAPAGSTAGTPFSITVTARDPYNNPAAGYTGTVHFTSSDGQASLLGDYTFLPADAGAHTFTAGVTLKTAGSRTVTASDGSIISSEAVIEVTPAAASQLVVTAAVTTTAGGTFSITVTARDAYNNNVPNYAGRIRFSSSDSQAGLPADYTFLPADAGVRTFTGGVLLKTAGGQTVTASDGAITGRAAVVVSPAAASKLIVSGFPSPTTAGANDSFTVAVEDPYGNVAASFDGTVHFTSSDAQASLSVVYSFLPADAGVHTFTSGVALKTAGSQTFTASAGSITGSAAVVVSPAAASKVILSGSPSRTTARVAGGVTVTFKDSYGNVATGYAGTVHFSSSDPKARIVDPSTGRLVKLRRFRYAFKSIDRGVHTFSVTLKTPRRQSITVMAGMTASITVKDARASRWTQRR
jgi:ELWxxDGT repeat protein